MFITYDGLQASGIMHDEKVHYIYFMNSCKNDIDLICEMRKLSLKEFMIIYQSYDEYCNYCKNNNIEDDCDRFMFQFQYRFNELVGQYQAV